MAGMVHTSKLSYSVMYMLVHNNKKIKCYAEDEGIMF
jgi:hypothetical protein